MAKVAKVVVEVEVAKAVDMMGIELTDIELMVTLAMLQSLTGLSVEPVSACQGSSKASTR